ncbi:MAG TPA: DUF3106 domain-containing protein [Planctomycetota bacterium]|nr:DUF3106 domain-containing protein [Planctomycetota bacterium]
MIRRLVRPALALAALAALAPLARAQDAAAGPDAVAVPDAKNRLREARARWDCLGPEERARVLRNFEAWKGLPSERRASLRRRFETLGGADGAAVLREKVEQARKDSPERLARLRLQAEAVRRIEEHLVDGLAPDAAERYRALPEDERAEWRRWFARRLLRLGREEVLRRHATEAEALAARGPDAEARRRALHDVLLRARADVLEPHRAELEGLSASDRRRREFVLMEERFWQGVREGVERVRADFLKSLLRAPGGREPRNGGAGAKLASDEARERFAREFGVTAESVGPRWARVLVATARFTAPADGAEREAWLARLRPALAAAAALPPPERDAALRAIVRDLRGK